MKPLLWATVGITLVILWHTLGWPLIGWALTRIPPGTPTDWQPRHRTWKNGIEQWTNA